MALAIFNCSVTADVDNNENVEHSYNIYMLSDGKNPEEAEAVDLTIEDLRLMRDEIKKSIYFQKLLQNEDSMDLTR